MSVTALGAEAKCGKLKCETLEAKNSGGDPHKVVGDLEITGDAVVDGQLTAKHGDIRIEPKSGSNQSTLTLRCPDQTWDITADSAGSTLSVGLFKDGGGSGVEVFTIQDLAGDISTGIVAEPLILKTNVGATASATLAPTHYFVININNTKFKMLLEEVPP